MADRSCRWCKAAAHASERAENLLPILRGLGPGRKPHHRRLAPAELISSAFAQLGGDECFHGVEMGFVVGKETTVPRSDLQVQPQTQIGIVGIGPAAVGLVAGRLHDPVRAS
jgi:hypothetical protein